MYLCIRSCCVRALFAADNDGWAQGRIMRASSDGRGKFWLEIAEESFNLQLRKALYYGGPASVAEIKPGAWSILRPKRISFIDNNNDENVYFLGEPRNGGGGLTLINAENEVLKRIDWVKGTLSFYENGDQVSKLRSDDANDAVANVLQLAAESEVPFKQWETTVELLADLKE